MKLTIGMIVKNEEKWLDKCLSAIKPILEHVDSELIITDTGSTDRTVEIAKKYTENIIHFEWINDFAAARNTGLEKAKGEWFMFLDADEIFRSCDNIIEFFNSGEYQKYNSATFVINNHTNDEGTLLMFRAQRLTRITSKSRFEGIVHELINTFGDPVKRLSDVADHYGYAFSDTESAKKKSKRNTDLLIKKLNLEKESDPIIFTQLYDNFLTGDDKENADRYLKKGIDYCKKKNSIVLAVLYVRKAFDEVSTGRYFEAIKTCYDYLNMNKSIRKGRLTSDREIYAILASSLLRTNDLIGAEQAFAEFFDVYEMTVSGELDTPEADAIRFFASADYNYIPFVNAFLYCCTTNGHYDIAAEYMSKLPIYKHSENKDGLKDTIMFEARILENLGLGYYDAFVKQLDDYGKSELEKAVEKLRPKSNTNSELEQLAKALKSNIRNLISNGSYDNARKFLCEYQKINPGDPEIPELLAMIG